MTQAHISTIQILRAVAALSVFAFHLADSLAADFGVGAGNMFRIGANGVDIFFVISGFIICFATRTDQSVAGFAIKRSVRILPLYYLLTLGVFFVALVAPQLLNSTTASLSELFKSLAFIPYEKDNGLVQPLLFLGWTLNYEMFFYALFAIALMAREHRIYVVSLMIVAIVAMGRAYDGDNVAVKFYTSGLLLEFLWGCLVYLAYEKAPRAIHALRHAWPIAVVLLLAQNFYEPDLPQAVSKGLPSALLLASLLSLKTPDTPTFRFFEKLGDASYSIYLVHPYIIQAFAKIVIPLIGVGALSMGLMIAASTALTIFVSILLFEWFEKPSNLWLRAQLLKRNKPAPNSAPASADT